MQVDDIFSAVQSGDTAQLIAAVDYLTENLMPRRMELSTADVHRLTVAIVSRYRRERDPARRCMLLFVLGKFFDQSLVPFFQYVLREELEGDGAALWQAIIALDNLDQPILTPKRSGSIREVEINRAHARRYLQNFADAQPFRYPEER